LAKLLIGREARATASIDQESSGEPMLASTTPAHITREAVLAEIAEFDR
jgi:hypothetical protein